MTLKSQCAIWLGVVSKTGGDGVDLKRRHFQKWRCMHAFMPFSSKHVFIGLLASSVNGQSIFGLNFYLLFYFITSLLHSPLDSWHIIIELPSNNTMHTPTYSLNYQNSFIPKVRRGNKRHLSAMSVVERNPIYLFALQQPLVSVSARSPIYNTPWV